MSAEDRLLHAAVFYLGGSYTTKGPQVPFGLPSGFARLPDGKATNCSTMTACLLAATYPEAPWDAGAWGQLQVYDRRRLDSPMEAVHRMGVGFQVDTFTEGRWHLVQGWRSLDPLRGHAFLVKGMPDGRELVLQASSRNQVGPTLDLKARGWTSDTYPHRVYIALLRE